MKPLNIKQETELERLHRLEKTLVTIYDSLPFAIKAFLPVTTLEFITEMRQRIAFDIENPPSATPSRE